MESRLRRYLTGAGAVGDDVRGRAVLLPRRRRLGRDAHADRRIRWMANSTRGASTIPMPDGEEPVISGTAAPSCARAGAAAGCRRGLRLDQAPADGNLSEHCRMGPGIYGIEAAARLSFQRSASASCRGARRRCSPSRCPTRSTATPASPAAGCRRLRRRDQSAELRVSGDYIRCHL